MADLPSGTVTFLFADIEGSTSLLQLLRDRYVDVLATYRKMLRGTIEGHGGRLVSVEGDSCFAAFPRASEAIAAAVAAQRAILDFAWPEGAGVRVRMGLHTGEPASTDLGYVGIDVHRAARICAVGHGGQVLLSGTTRDLAAGVLPEGAALQDLGPHRLKDLAQPQHLFQVVAAGLPSTFPPLKSVTVVPHNLPVELTSFIGREREIAEVKQRLTAARLLTLTGVGGAGKTRLALRVAAEMAEIVPGGVWVVELASLSDATLVPHAVASSLGVLEQVGRTPAETLGDYLRSKELLLLLDNCEHLVDPCARLAQVLLMASPRLRILATSRESLGIPGESVYHVPPLSVPRQDRNSLMQYEAVRLFVDRALLTNPGFELTAGNARAVAQVCRLLEGIALAIELAAAWVKVLSVEVIAARLRGSRLLSGGPRTAPDRHRTLRGAMDWSYSLLSRNEQVLLCRLAVFAGGFTLEAAERVCTDGELTEEAILDLLARLVDKSLVLVEDDEGRLRYRLLETIRQYARERLIESNNVEGLRARHRDWYASLAEQAEPELRGPSQRVWLAALEKEHDNLRAALECPVEDTVECGLRLAGALWLFWYKRGYWSEGRHWLDEALSRTAGRVTTERAKALVAAAALALAQGDLRQAEAQGEESLHLSRQLGDTPGVAIALNHLGYVASAHGRYEQAKALSEESLRLARELGDEWTMGFPLNNLGLVALAQEHLDCAAARFEESLALRTKVSDHWGIASSLHLLGNIAYRRGDHHRAAAKYRESLALSSALVDRRTVAYCLEGLAGTALATGELQRAARLFGAVEVLRESIGFPLQPAARTPYEHDVAKIRNGLGDAAFAAVWTDGRAMTLEQTVEYALATL